jgi:magnesium transporter
MAEDARYDKSVRQLKLVASALQSGRLAAVRRLLNSLTPGEIARVLESLSLDQRRIAWGLVDPDDDGEVLVHVADEVRTSLIEDMDREELLAATGTLELDDLADLLEDLPAQLT